MGSQPLYGDARGAAVLCAGQMGDAREDLVGHEGHRVVPGLAVPHVVEAEQQQVAEAADVGVDLLDLCRHGVRRADEPIVRGAILHRDRVIRRGRVCLE